jgi:hypothetical protein
MGLEPTTFSLGSWGSRSGQRVLLRDMSGQWGKESWSPEGGRGSCRWHKSTTGARARVGNGHQCPWQKHEERPDFGGIGHDPVLGQDERCVTTQGDHRVRSPLQCRSSPSVHRERDDSEDRARNRRGRVPRTPRWTAQERRPRHVDRLGFQFESRRLGEGVRATFHLSPIWMTESPVRAPLRPRSYSWIARCPKPHFGPPIRRDSLRWGTLGSWHPPPFAEPFERWPAHSTGCMRE